MLYLNPPYHVIEGVSLLPDHADPLQFYYQPLSPHLTLLKDEATGQKIPQLQVILYTGATASGGFLNFDCDLGLNEKQFDAVRTGVAAAAGASAEEIKLAPVPLVDGTVRMMLLGKESPPLEPPRPGQPAPAAPAPTGPQFVLKIQSFGKPSLYGDNRAAFSVQLDPEGVTILEQAMMGEMSPIGVVYSLSYVGLRPAYNVSVHADWNRVQTHVSESFSVNTLFYSQDIDKVVDKLVEDRAIVIEADTFVAAGDGSDDVLARRDQALADVREMVKDTFFEPSLEPMEGPNPTGGTLDTFARVTQLLARGGQSSMFSRKEVDLTRIDQKTLSVNFSERTAVMRNMHPQGHLAGLFRVLEQEGLDKEKFILRVGLDHPFFQRRKLRVLPFVDFQAPADAPDRVQSVTVTATYEGQPQSLVFDAAHATEQSLDWASVLDGNAMRRDVQVTTTVNFAPPASGRRPSSLTGTQVLTGDALTLSPRGELYEVRAIAISSVDFPWDRYHTVEVECAYADAPNGIEQSAQFTLTRETVAQFTWPVFMLDATARTIRHRLVMHGADGRDVDRGWVEAGEDTIRIVDPFPARRTLGVIAPQALFTTVDRVFVDVHYTDAGNGVDKRESFEMTAQDAATKTFSVELLDPEQRQVSFQATFVMADGTTVVVPESSTTQERIVLRPDMKGHRAVQMRVAPMGDFTASGLREIVVEAAYDDELAKLHFADVARFTTPAERRSFEFDYVDTAKDGYRYRVTHRYANGLERTSEWADSDSPELVVPVA